MGPWLAFASVLLGSAAALTSVPPPASSAAVGTAGVPARLLVLTTLVPGQRLKVGQDCWQEGLQIGEGAPSTFWDLFNEGPLVCVGRQGVSLHARGVEVCLEGDGVIAASGRIAEILHEGEDEGSRWAGRAGRVQWLGCLDDSDLLLSPNDATTTDIAPELLQAVCTTVGDLSLEWEALARGRERFPGHLDQILRDLGPMPFTDRPNARAMWVAGLLNPHPALGVALEIRPAVLTARSTSRRLSMAKQGLEDSIRRLQRGTIFELGAEGRW
eukprot:CAMPEP_0173219070 /NCGR_PEP_ID=MMETSP1142-20121109/1408_1 /TAXON_ID=483371 /ORGANISM="non described non described, Strain CCMP2298" /LENGTH=270 /DNA_ID=CAMNT_0014146843 /DNA_START=46 /DNA_END=855 /DNA_ORIENTATION=-